MIQQAEVSEQDNAGSDDTVFINMIKMESHASEDSDEDPQSAQSDIAESDNVTGNSVTMTILSPPVPISLPPSTADDGSSSRSINDSAEDGQNKARRLNEGSEIQPRAHAPAVLEAIIARQPRPPLEALFEQNFGLDSIGNSIHSEAESDDNSDSVDSKATTASEIRRQLSDLRRENRCVDNTNDIEVELAFLAQDYRRRRDIAYYSDAEDFRPTILRLSTCDRNGSIHRPWSHREFLDATHHERQRIDNTMRALSDTVHSQLRSLRRLENLAIARNRILMSFSDPYMDMDYHPQSDDDSQNSNF